MARWFDAAIISSGALPSLSMIPTAVAPMTSEQSSHNWLNVPIMS